ncbi:MAG: hypothetical protein R2849_10580 [Thermomicrobiales bacterium]
MPSKKELNSVVIQSIALFVQLASGMLFVSVQFTSVGNCVSPVTQVEIHSRPKPISAQTSQRTLRTLCNIDIAGICRIAKWFAYPSANLQSRCSGLAGSEFIFYSVWLNVPVAVD